MQFLLLNFMLSNSWLANAADNVVSAEFVVELCELFLKAMPQIQNVEPGRVIASVLF